MDVALAGAGKPMLPFAWQGVSLAGPAGGALRMKIELREQAIGLLAFDQSGEAVLSVTSVAAREIDPDALRGAALADSLYLVRWQEPPAQALTSSFGGHSHPKGRSQPRLLSLAELDFERSGDAAATALAATRSALARVQAWLADEEHAAERLVLLTEGAVAGADGESPDPTAAALWGLLRSARSEHPGRFALIDSDGSEASAKALEGALSLTAEEPEIALRAGGLRVPRLAPAAPAEPAAEPLDPDSTVLVTGGLSGIGALVARHLVASHGARRLLLASRRGIESEGAAELVGELEAGGAAVTVRACDVSDREQLRELFDAVDPEHPLGTIVHSAGLVDDGLIESLDEERLARVFEPKAKAAWHLHELSRDRGAPRLLFFSSIAGALGGAAQANYSAANAFLDALAQRRRAEGLPAVSLGWGLLRSGMGAALSTADLARIERLGFAALSDERVLALFDAVLSGEHAHVLPVELNRPALRALAGQGALPAIFSGLVRAPAGRSGKAGSLADLLAATAEERRGEVVLDLVLGHAATILGHANTAAVDPELAFRDLGFDSLAAVELRNGLGTATGLRLAPTIVFDYPTPAALAAHLLATASPDGNGGGPQLESGEREVREALASIPLARLRSAGLLDSLLRLAGGEGEAEDGAGTAAGLIDEMDVEELIRESVDSAEADPNERQAG